MLENSQIQIKHKILPYLQFAGVQMKDCLWALIDSDYSKVFYFLFDSPVHNQSDMYV